MLHLPLTPGATGQEVTDLQERLTTVGITVAGDPPGSYGASTTAAIADFQVAAGLDATGVCDRATWSALVEAGYRLGDRQLYHRSPMLRGDDVAELQRRLGALGFDAGRVDGIFGPDTAGALAEFQRNSGLPSDGIFGPDSLAALHRLGGRTEALTIATIREHEHLLSRSTDLHELKLAVGDDGAASIVVTTLSRQLRDLGATVIGLEHPDNSVQAREANAFAADAYIGCRVRADPGARCAYFRSHGFESRGGRRLADLVRQGLEDACDLVVPEPIGMRLPILRETRMPAVVVELGPARFVVEQANNIAAALNLAIQHWAQAPLDSLARHPDVAPPP